MGVDLYDGGKKSALIEQAKNEYEASTHDTNDVKKSLSLQIVENFYSIMSHKASLNAKEDAGKSLQEQLHRVGQFYKAGLATTIMSPQKNNQIKRSFYS